MISAVYLLTFSQPITIYHVIIRVTLYFTLTIRRTLRCCRVFINFFIICDLLSCSPFCPPTFLVSFFLSFLQSGCLFLR